MKNLFAASLFLISLRSWAQAEHIIEINPTTGTFTKVCSPIPNVGWVAPEDGVYDEINGIFYFVSASPCACLQGINITNGAFVSSPTISAMMTYQFDNSSNTLYGLKQDNANNLKMFGSVNPVTASFTQVGPSRAGSSLYQGSLNAFDETQHHFIFLEPSNTLVSINATTGSVVASPTLQLASGEIVLGLVFNNQNGKLFGTLNDNGLQTSWLVTIDPLTGICTKIGSGTGLNGPNGSAAINETGGKYLMLHSSSSGFAISSIDISTGLLISTANLPLLGQENAFNLVYDRIRDRVFAIHWSISYEFVGLSENTNTSLSVFPVPATQEVTVELPLVSLLKASLYDAFGKQVLQQDVSGLSAFTLKRGTLTDGVYFLQLKSEGSFIEQRKIVFANE